MKKLAKMLLMVASSVFSLMATYFFLYIIFALDMSKHGISPLWGISYCVLGSAGSFESIMANAVSRGTSILSIIFLTIASQIRYPFYSLYADIFYKDLPPILRGYVHLALTDEVFDQGVAKEFASLPFGLTRAQYCLCITALLHFSGFCGQIVGILLGSLDEIFLSAASIAIVILFLNGFVQSLFDKKKSGNAILGFIVTSICWFITSQMHWDINLITFSLVMIIGALLFKRFLENYNAKPERG